MPSERNCAVRLLSRHTLHFSFLPHSSEHLLSCLCCDPWFTDRFSFHDLCENPLGAEDYAKLSSSYHTVVIEDIPKMDISNANLARRFITLVGMLAFHSFFFFFLNLSAFSACFWFVLTHC
jgi:hypothetical protein